MGSYKLKKVAIANIFQKIPSLVFNNGHHG